MDNKTLLEKMLKEKYYTAREIMYSTNPGFYIQPYNYQMFLDYLDQEAMTNDEDFVKINLKTFNKYEFRITKCYDLLSRKNEYLNLVFNDLKENKSFLTFRNLNQITISRIFSEIEGTLNIEAVPTTRSLLNNIIKDNKKPINNNEQIIYNMAKAIEFVNECPEFNEENLYRLYSLLSYNSLADENMLKDNQMYRHDGVEIDGYKGCPHERIKECMDSLFQFINNNLNNNEDLKIYLPHIAHYYIVYVHPYFDYNGRTARMVSYWIHLLLKNDVLPPVISEAINQTKNEYYLSLRETRNSHNDLTYFLNYIYSVSIKYFLTYKNIEIMDEKLKNNSIIISETDKNYIKRILISSKGKFTYEDFIKWTNTSMTKQGAFKILNKLEEYKILISEINKSNKKLFEVNKLMLEYKI